jgi:hypothetical protein
MYLPNVMTDRLAFLIRIQEILGLNLAQKLEILTEVSRGFPHFLQANCLELGDDRLPTSFLSLQPFYHSMLYSLTADRAVK